MHTTIVIVGKTKGIFVGEDDDGRFFWTKVDATGEACVATFPDEQAAKDYLDSRKIPRGPSCYQFVSVQPDIEGEFASARALIRAGLFFELGTLALLEEEPAPETPPAGPAPLPKASPDATPGSDRS